MKAAFSQGWLQGCAAMDAQGCPSEQRPCAPRGCVLVQELCCLPGSALILPGELPTVLWGEAVGGRNDPWQHRGLLLRWCCMGQGCSQLQTTTGHSQGLFKKHIKAGAT